MGWIRLIFVQPTHEQMNQNVADNLNPKTIHKKRLHIEIAHLGDFGKFKDPLKLFRIRLSASSIHPSQGAVARMNLL